ncbi:MAG TPA: histidine kinase [Jiangellaceae bacterium]|nr:histidine kinase [Jiangellaceae bacterium]
MRLRVHDVWTRAAGRLTRDDWVDAAFALLMAAVATVETLSGNYDEGPVWLVVVTGLLLTLPLALRRRYPIGVYALVLVMIVVQAGVLGSNEGVGIFFGLLVSLYTLAAHRPLRPALIGLLAFVPLMAFSNWRADGNPFEDLSFILTLTGGAWVAGRIVWSRQQMVDQLSAQAVQLERGRAAEARVAAAEERARIARDLHDVVAHSVSVMVVQAEAAEALLPDSDRSGQALRAIQDTGRSTLAELRHLLGALDDEGATSDTVERTTRQPSPRLRDADRLVEQLRAAGLDVSLTVEGGTTEIPSGVDLAAYRVLQEALTNALRHAGRTSVEATVRITTDEVMVEVIDRGPAAPPPHQFTTANPGRGLVGMRERVTLYGGQVESGPAGPGFRVRARIPVRASE